MNDPIGNCLYCGKPIRYSEKNCRFCGKENRAWVVPDRTQCGNCHAHLDPEDNYCRICGTKAGEGEFEPYQNLMQCIYGPEPVQRVHKCCKCGFSWTACLMIDDERFCPKCGGDAPYEGYRPNIEKLI